MINSKKKLVGDQSSVLKIRCGIFVLLVEIKEELKRTWIKKALKRLNKKTNHQKRIIFVAQPRKKTHQWKNYNKTIKLSGPQEGFFVTSEQMKTSIL